MPKQRLDQLVVQRGLAESRAEAQRLIRAGSVRRGDERLTKPGLPVDERAALRVDEPPRFVGRGGLKLQGALDEFSLTVSGEICLDLGASTGGFTDCLLQAGAARVMAVDVGRGQLHWKLRNDGRVVVCEQVNARHLEPEDLPLTATFCAIDVSFISLEKILPAAVRVTAEAARIVTLIKPQFEAGREKVGKGGVVRDPAVHEEVVEKIRVFAEGECGLRRMGLCRSPLTGPAGNVEYLALWKK
jgi:23S rRNA (cytidine1920-2'-O)/16S rRNA (cytidine1409-2'-O)-methyltransferase